MCIRDRLITIVILLVLGAVGLMLWVGGINVIEGLISAGELAAFVFYSVIVGSAVASISEVIGELQRAIGADADFDGSEPEVLAANELGLLATGLTACLVGDAVFLDDEVADNVQRGLGGEVAVVPL